MIWLFKQIKELRKCRHDWIVVNPEEVKDGFIAIKKCKKCGCWLS